jgi:hypothetical protein
MTTLLDTFINTIDTADSLNLNDEQSEVYMKIISKNFSKMLLLGEAGAGKTYVLTAALAQLHRQGAKVLLCAPTHLARQALLNKMPEDVRPFIETKTVASLLSRFGFGTGDGNMAFSQPKRDRINSYEVIAIDEASMIGKKEYDVLMGTHAKLIFTGDFAQLPAIMQQGSGMMDDPTVEKFQLMQQMRAPGLIHKIAERNREEIFYPEKSEVDDTGSVTVHASVNEMLERMVADIVSDPRGVDGHVNYRFITHTNAFVSEVGGMIRNQVLTQELGYDVSATPFVTGEYLLAYQSTAAAYNGEVVKVVDVSTSQVPGLYPWRAYNVCIEGGRGASWMNVIAPGDRHLADKRVEELQELLKEANKRKAFDAAAAYLEQIEHINNFYVKLMYPFAVTCHKSQGMTIESVYVDTVAFSKANNKRALLYVGLSRASKALHTVVVEPPQWKLVRDINDRYRLLKVQWEEAFAEPHWKARLKSGLPASTAEQKQILCDWMECVLLDWEQEQADNADEDVLSADDM